MSVRRDHQLCITVVGLGYVGLTTAVGLASLGHDVSGVEVDAARLASLRAGRVPIHEPGLQAALEAQHTRLTFTDNLRAALERRPHAVMIAVPTPAECGGALVERTAADVARALVADATIVIRSTAPLGTARRVARIIADATVRPLPVVVNPEFLVEGRAYEAFMAPDRIVIGIVGESGGDAGSLMRRLYGGIDAPVVETDAETAELAKLAANAFLATQVSFINEVADIAAASGADIDAVSRILKLDRRVGPGAYLRAGAGFGGACLPKDLRALIDGAEQLGVDARVARAVADVNDARAERTVETLHGALGGLAGRRVGVWGLAFKGGTDDVRESPAVAVVRRLLAEGADVRAYDPLAEPNAAPLVGGAVLCDGLYTPAEDAEALVVLTECAEFAHADFEMLRARMRGRVVVDGRGIMPAEMARAAGFDYRTIGEGLVPAPRDKAERQA
jgi:UDPglucose 6-dehydrogenase